MATDSIANKNFSLIETALSSNHPENIAPLSPREQRFVGSKGDFTKNFTPQEYASFMQNICMTFNAMMQKHREQHKKDAEKLRASAEGKEYDDV